MTRFITTGAVASISEELFVELHEQHCPITWIIVHSSLIGAFSPKEVLKGL
ncbi:9735_t:CDS:1, partial [Dentiscutata heterogama]